VLPKGLLLAKIALTKKAACAVHGDARVLAAS
jgi:hypothetical protein